MAQRRRSAARDFQIRILRGKFGKRRIQAALYVLFQLYAVETNALYFFALRQSQNGAVRLHHGGYASGKVLYKFRQAQRRTELQHHFHQALCAFSMLVWKVKKVLLLDG